MNNSKTINFKGQKYAVNLKWHNFMGKKGIVRNKIKDTMKKNQYEGFGVKKETSNQIQVGFGKKSQKGEVSLAQFLSSKESLHNSLILINFDKDQYWMCAVTADGYIESGTDVLQNQEDFIANLSSYFTLLDVDDSFSIKILEEDADELNSIIGEEMSEFNVSFLEDEELKLDNVKGLEIESIYNTSIDLAKQIGSLGLLGAILTSGYYFVYLEDPLYDQIINQDVSGSYYTSKINYENFVKKQEKELSNSFEIIAKKEILKETETSYKKSDLYNNIEKLSLTFPIFLVEWELEGLSYNKAGSNEFFRVSYKRIKNSFGNTPELKMQVAKIMEKINVKDYSFQNPSTKGDRLFVNIKFKNNLKTSDNSLNVLEQEVNDKIDVLDKKIKRYAKSIERIENEVMEFSFMDKRFGSVLEEKENEILDIVSKSNKIYKEMKEERKKLEVDDVKINEAIISGNKIDIMSMQQSYSYYDWSEGSKTKTFPQVKRGSRKKGEEVRFYAQATNIDVTDGGNIDLVGLKGLKNMLVNKNLFNKPYIQVNNISYNVQSEEWNIKGEYYEKI